MQITTVNFNPNQSSYKYNKGNVSFGLLATIEARRALGLAEQKAQVKAASIAKKKQLNSDFYQLLDIILNIKAICTHLQDRATDEFLLGVRKSGHFTLAKTNESQYPLVFDNSPTLYYDNADYKPLIDGLNDPKKTRQQITENTAKLKAAFSQQA